MIVHQTFQPLSSFVDMIVYIVHKYDRNIISYARTNEKLRVTVTEYYSTQCMFIQYYIEYKVIVVARYT